MVTILDRTGEQQEIKYDQRIYSFGKKTTQILPLEVASWVFRGTHFYVHTTDGEFVRRYGVVDAPEDWITETGVDVLETSPLTRNVSRVEGWDVEAVRTAPTKILDLKTSPAAASSGEYANQGAAGAAGRS